MLSQVFKLSDIQINYLELFTDNEILSHKCFDFTNNTVTLTDKELELLIEQITKYHAEDLETFNDILNVFLKHDRNNVIKEYVPQCGLIIPII